MQRSQSNACEAWIGAPPGHIGQSCVWLNFRSPASSSRTCRPKFPEWSPKLSMCWSTSTAPHSFDCSGCSRCTQNCRIGSPELARLAMLGDCHSATEIRFQSHILYPLKQQPETDAFNDWDGWGLRCKLSCSQEEEASKLGVVAGRGVEMHRNCFLVHAISTSNTNSNNRDDHRRQQLQPPTPHGSSASSSFSSSSSTTTTSTSTSTSSISSSSSKTMTRSRVWSSDLRCLQCCRSVHNMRLQMIAHEFTGFVMVLNLSCCV